MGEMLEQHRLIDTSDLYQQTGFALELLASSEYHREHCTYDYFLVEILPAIQNQQIKIYVDQTATPYGLVTWALLSQAVEQEITSSGRALSRDEWRCGERLFFNDWIAPFGHLRSMVHDFRFNIFPNQKTASSIRRNRSTSIRKVNRWLGPANLKDE